METLIHAEFRAEPAEVSAGQPAALIFTVKDNQGTLVRQLRVVHEKTMHLLVISEDLNDFEHLHPEQTEDGSFLATYMFQHGGNYRLYVDFNPPGSNPVVDRFNLTVNGSGRPAAVPVEDMAGITAVEKDGLNVTLTIEKPVRAGEETLLNFAITDTQTHKPVTDLQPYLGAMAHFVIISRDGKDFLHAHPIERNEISAHNIHQGHNTQKAKSHMHGMSTAGVSEVGAHTMFPRAGVYKIWAQFQRGGRIITVPFVVVVGE